MAPIIPQESPLLGPVVRALIHLGMYTSGQTHILPGQRAFNATAVAEVVNQDLGNIAGFVSFAPKDVQDATTNNFAMHTNATGTFLLVMDGDKCDWRVGMHNEAKAEQAVYNLITHKTSAGERTIVNPVHKAKKMIDTVGAMVGTAVNAAPVRPRQAQSELALAHIPKARKNRRGVSVLHSRD